jgi:hypothetical protein
MNDFKLEKYNLQTENSYFFLKENILIILLFLHTEFHFYNFQS